jgi:hypothetical protein
MRLTDDQGLPKAGKDPVVKLDIVGDNGEPTGPGEYPIGVGIPIEAMEAGLKLGRGLG